MTNAKVTLIPSTDLQNITREGLGFRFDATAPAAFIVLAECSHDEPREVARFEHNGSVFERARAFTNARNIATGRQDYAGDMVSYNTYEEIPLCDLEPVALEGEACEAVKLPHCVSTLTREQAATLSYAARTVRQDLRKKAVSLKGLRAINGNGGIMNPYYHDRRERRVTADLWAMVMACVSDRIEPTATGLLGLELRADLRVQELEEAAAQTNEAGNAPLRVGDAVNDGGITRHITMIRGDSVIVVLDHRIEVFGQSVQRIETIDSITARIAKQTGVTEACVFEALTGTDFKEAEAVALIMRRKVETLTAESTNRALEERQAHFFGGMDFAARRDAIEAAHAEALEINDKVNTDLAILRNDIEAFRREHTGEKLAEVIDYAIRHVFNRIVHVYGVMIHRDQFEDLKRTPEQLKYSTPAKTRSNAPQGDESDLGYVGMDESEKRASVAEKGLEFDVESEAQEFIDQIGKNEPAADIYRLDYSEIAERVQTEKANPCSTRPVARGFLALQISRTQLQLTPDLDTNRDALSMHILNCLAFGVLTSREHEKAHRIASHTTRPREALLALQDSLTTGADILEALKQAGK
ncbi:TPA: hypothetical protein QH074_004344 [Enterobacter hormaechei subsp. steigerwaltii]|nr:hypothetical protein [Enterobacter hormaechei subsp. steigerwaltii]